MDAIDLGLSVKWASCNLGATKPEEYGNYYAYGEITTKTIYDWNTYKWCNGSYDTQTKYCTSNYYGITDNKSTLNLEDDAANANLDSKWHIPTHDEWVELRTNCTCKWTCNYNETGITGRIVTSKINNNSIFLPAAGFRHRYDLYNAGYDGHYWSSLLRTDFPFSAWSVNFVSDMVNTLSSERYYGLSVRPVLK